MHRYRVIQRWPEESWFALRCNAGFYHLSRALSGLPAADARLEGDRPHLGFGILRCPLSGATYRVIFESIGHSSWPLAPGAMPGTTARPPVAGTSRTTATGGDRGAPIGAPRP